MRLEKFLAIGSQYLTKKNIQTAFLDAQILLCYSFNITKEKYLTNPKAKASLFRIFKYFFFIYQRGAGKPIAYITKNKEFYGLNFYVNKNVLIPRPETEILIEELLTQLLNVKNQLLTIAEIGTGSGCIAITLAKNLPKAKIIATDISKKALEVAKKNAKTHQIKINFYQGSLLDPIKENIDIIIANLPYGWNAWKNNSSAETIGLKFEPRQALFTKEQGLYLYRLLFEQIEKRNYQPKLVLCEFDPRQVKEITELANTLLPQYQIEIKKDLAELDRVIILNLKN